jgi:peptidyl-prolyl cis-trans isomerase C
MLAALAACLPLAGCGGEAAPMEEAAEGDVSAEAATVNGQVIYVSDVDMEARMRGLVKPGETLAPGSAEFDEVLEGLIEVKLLAVEAVDRRLDEEPEARHRLNTARDQILMNILLERIAEDKIDEAALRKMYEAQLQLLEPDLETEAHVRHILAPTRDAIEKIAAELKTGVDFAVLAARRSTDAATRLDGGDLGYLTAGAVSPELARVIRDIPKGGVSRPFEDAQGWHIVKVEDVRKKRPPSIDELDEKIRRFLKEQEFEKILKELRADAEIVKRNPARSSRLDAPAATAAPKPVERAPAAPAPEAPAPDTSQGITILPMEPVPPPAETRDPAAPPTPATPQ